MPWSFFPNLEAEGTTDDVRGRIAIEKLYTNLIVISMAVFGTFAIALLLAKWGSDTDILFLTFLAGCVGGVLNNYTRVSAMDSAKNPAITTTAQLRVAVIQLYISFFVAGILAFVIYGIFASKLATGPLFPKFVGYDQNYESVTQLLKCLAPEKNEDAAKAVIWGFVAGWSEKLLPNLLDAFTKRAGG